MPRIKLVATRRASALIASVVAASISGYVAIFPGRQPVPEDVALAIRIMQPWEGRHLVAYLDRIPTKPVWTICDGDTENVRQGMVETQAGCDERSARRMVRDFRPALVGCIDNWDGMPLSVRGSMLSLAWNIGSAATCTSTAARRAREGRFEDACIAATAFVRSGGREVSGLVKRRGMGDALRPGEGEVCITGLQLKT